MSEHHKRQTHGAVKTTIVAIAIFIAGSLMLLWSWNTLAVDLFQLPDAHFRHAVAFGGLIAAAFMLRLFVARIALGGSPRTGHRGGGVS